jgi:hypothetical protein
LWFQNTINRMRSFAAGTGSMKCHTDATDTISCAGMSDSTPAEFNDALWGGYAYSFCASNTLPPMPPSPAPPPAPVRSPHPHPPPPPPPPKACAFSFYQSGDSNFHTCATLGHKFMLKQRVDTVAKDNGPWKLVRYRQGNSHECWPDGRGHLAYDAISTSGCDKDEPASFRALFCRRNSNTEVPGRNYASTGQQIKERDVFLIFIESTIERRSFATDINDPTAFLTTGGHNPADLSKWNQFNADGVSLADECFKTQTLQNDFEKRSSFWIDKDTQDGADVYRIMSVGVGGGYSWAQGDYNGGKYISRDNVNRLDFRYCFYETDEDLAHCKDPTRGEAP